MQVEDLNLIVQVIESLDLVSKELEKALTKGNVEQVKKAKEEILNLQKQMSKIIE